MDDKSLDKYIRPLTTSSQPSIAPPDPIADNFELRTDLINLIHQNLKFEGQSDENPYTRITDVLAICG
ncbi:hypothetical protein LINGRAHAP2_LOCUS13968, partial [Linum grandiflorum]